MLPPKNSVADRIGSILLIEEYSALASAFSALLHKFAPGHVVQVAQTLDHATAILGDQAVDLLVVDVDPAQRGTAAFFKRLKTASPDLRVLIIAATDASDLGAEPNGPAAFSFIKKPFPLEGFGEAVRALVQPAASTPRLREMRLIDLLVLLAVSAASTVLRVDGAHGDRGEIHFAQGRIAHALVVGRIGRGALEEMLRWPAARVSELGRRSDAPRSITNGWQGVLRAALRATHAPEKARLREVAPPAPLPVLPAGKKILVIDDTETLLLFVEEVLATSDPTLQIMKAATGHAGLEKALTEKPDLILLDYSLPDITGGEVCRLLAANESSAQIPIVMMSGHVAEMLEVAESSTNVVAAIPKPFLSTALLDLIEKTLSDLPKLTARARKKSKSKTLPAISTEAAKTNGLGHGSHNGGAAKAKPKASSQSELPETPTIAEKATMPEPAIDRPEPASEVTTAEIEAAVSHPATPVPEATAEAASLEIAETPELSPAILRAGQQNAVVLTLPLEITSIQFSPALQMKAIRARPFGNSISLHLLPQSLPGSIIPEAGFEMARVKLDARGQIDTVFLAPTLQELATIATESSMPVGGIALSPVQGETAMELMPAASSPMRMQLTVLFELAGVELSNDFRVAHLVLKWRGGRMRVSLRPDAAQTGVTFETAQVLLDRSGRIAELLLDAVV